MSGTCGNGSKETTKKVEDGFRREDGVRKVTKKKKPARKLSAIKALRGDPILHDHFMFGTVDVEMKGEERKEGNSAEEVQRLMEINAKLTAYNEHLKSKYAAATSIEQSATPRAKKVDENDENIEEDKDDAEEISKGYASRSSDEEIERQSPTTVVSTLKAVGSPRLNGEHQEQQKIYRRRIDELEERVLQAEEAADDWRVKFELQLQQNAIYKSRILRLEDQLKDARAQAAESQSNAQIKNSSHATMPDAYSSSSTSDKRAAQLGAFPGDVHQEEQVRVRWIEKSDNGDASSQNTQAQAEERPELYTSTRNSSASTATVMRSSLRGSRSAWMTMEAEEKATRESSVQQRHPEREVQQVIIERERKITDEDNQSVQQGEYSAKSRMVQRHQSAGAASGFRGRGVGAIQNERDSERQTYAAANSSMVPVEALFQKEREVEELQQRMREAFISIGAQDRQISSVAERWEEKVDVLVAERDELRTENDLLHDKLTGLEQDLLQRTNALNKSVARTVQLERRVFDCEKEAERIRQDLFGECSVAEAVEARLATTVNELKMAQKRVLQREQELEEVRKTLRESEQEAQLQKQEMTERVAGLQAEFSNLCGQLSEISRIDAVASPELDAREGLIQHNIYSSSSRPSAVRPSSSLMFHTPSSTPLGISCPKRRPDETD